MATNGELSTDSAGRKRPPELQVGGRRLSSTVPLNITGSSVGLSNGISRHRRDHSGTSGSATVPSSASSALITSPTLKKSKLHKISSAPRKSKAQHAPLLVRLERQLEYTATKLNIILERHFRRHGKYVSRHPVRTLLVACLMITSLFYPAAGIYLWASKGGPGVTRGDARSVWRSLSTPFLDSFASSGRKHHNSLRDLRMVWDDAPDLRAVDARDAGTYLGSIAPLNIFPNSWPPVSNSDENKEKIEEKRRECTSVRVEHVFVTTDDVMLGMGHRYGALDVPILQSAMSLQSAIEAYLQRGHSRLQCLQAVGSKDCLTLSPLSYWKQDFRQLSADTSPTGTLLGTKMNVSHQGIPLSLTTTLAGRSHLFSKLPRADHLALTFFLYDKDDEEGKSCNSGSEKSRPSRSVADDKFSENHETWLGMLRNITGGQVGIVNSEITTTKEVVLQFNPLQTGNSFFTQRLLLSSSYAAAFLWLCRGLIRLQNVHSRFGLAFTGVLELILSMTLVVSICALCGVRLTLVPWEILPFVIVVLGSENMFVLTNAIISTPISLTVPTRIATGLGKVGVPIAVTVMSDVLLMLTIVMFVDVRAVREFCIFAIFSLFVDFFMQMTFFATVLSIDLQRLELADLLSQGGSKESHNNLSMLNQPGEDDTPISEDVPLIKQDKLDHIVRERSRKERISKSSLGGSFIKMSCRAVWRARTARTASLSLLLAFMFGIYLYHGSGYPSLHSYPFQQSNTTHSSISASIPTSTLIDDIDDSPRFDPYSHLSHESLDSLTTIPLPWWHNSPSALFWQALNPQDALSVRVKVEPWTILSLRSTKSFEKGQRRGMAHFATWAIFRPRVRAFIWFFKLAVLPIAGTTGLLWVLLLYLLKDTELLEAQRDRSEGFGGNISDEEDHQDAQPNRIDYLTEAEIHLSTSIASQSSDVTLLGQSGGYMISVAADSCLSVWKPSKRGRCSTIILSSVMKDYTRVTALEVDAELDLMALGHANGQVTIWFMSTLLPFNLSKLVKEEINESSSKQPLAQVQSIFFIPSAADRYVICSAHRDGSIWQWRQDHIENILAAQQGDAIWMSFTPSSSEGKCRNLIALTSSHRQFQIYRIAHSSPILTCLLSVQDESLIVRCATMSTLSFNEEEHSRENTWSMVVAGTNRGKVIVYDLKTSSKVDHYDVLDGPITSIRGVDFAHACPSLANSASRDLILINSATRATILTLSSQSSQQLLSLSPTSRSSNGNYILTPHKNRIGLPSFNSSSSFVGASPPKDRPVKSSNGVHKEASHANGNVTTNGNGIHEDGLLFEPLSLPKSLDNRNRRSSSQGKRPVFEEEQINHDELEPLSSSQSAIGSAPSSVLDHFEVDPFDAANGTLTNGDESSLHWSRHASIECTRGGTDIVMSMDGARIVGVRRRARQTSLAAPIDARWEVFQLDVNSIVTLEKSQVESLEATLIRRSRLELEDSLLFQQQSSSYTGISFNDFAPSSRSDLSSMSTSLPLLLSFTRLDHVQAFYKDKGGMEKAKKKEKRNIVFSFANCIACVTLYTS